jgi:hypothetical protein
VGGSIELELNAVGGRVAVTVAVVSLSGMQRTDDAQCDSRVKGEARNGGEARIGICLSVTLSVTVMTKNYLIAPEMEA